MTSTPASCTFVVYEFTRNGTVCRVTASGVILSASSGSTSKNPNMLVTAAAALRTRTPVNKPIRPAAVM